MNKLLKTILIILNLLMLSLAIYWYSEKKETEPLISIIGQIIALLVILFENNISKIRTNKINKSGVNIDTKPGSDIKTSNVTDSQIDIKNR